MLVDGSCRAPSDASAQRMRGRPGRREEAAEDRVIEVHPGERSALRGGLLETGEDLGQVLLIVARPLVDAARARRWRSAQPSTSLAPMSTVISGTSPLRWWVLRKCSAAASCDPPGRSQWRILRVGVIALAGQHAGRRVAAATELDQLRLWTCRARSRADRWRSPGRCPRHPVQVGLHALGQRVAEREVVVRRRGRLRHRDAWQCRGDSADRRRDDREQDASMHRVLQSVPRRGCEIRLIQAGRSECPPPANKIRHI